MSCKYNNCKICGYKSECEIFKENARLKEINTHTLSQLNLDNGELIIENEKLKKENAELKERNAELKGMYAHSAREAGIYKQFLELKEKENAKAKELLTRFVMASVYFNGKETDLVEEAEQYLSEVEK